jgi:hypothetical protein
MTRPDGKKYPQDDSAKDNREQSTEGKPDFTLDFLTQPNGGGYLQHTGENRPEAHASP